MNKLKVTAVSYLNTKPLLFGIFKNEVAEAIDLELDIPSICADKLKAGEATLGLVPVAVIPKLPNARIVSDYCIGTVGAVKTVNIYSQVPIDQLTHLYLDFHSRTSVILVQILLAEYWKVEPKLIPATSGFMKKIKGKTAGLVIGDRTIGLEKQFPFVYDLGEAWEAHTGLPFVFAAWVSTAPLEPTFLEDFNLALKSGIDAIPQLVNLIPPPLPDFDLKDYFTNFISYELDHAKKEGLDLFFEKMAAYERSVAKSLEF